MPPATRRNKPMKMRKWNQIRITLEAVTEMRVAGK